MLLSQDHRMIYNRDREKIMYYIERHHKILEILNQSGVVYVKDLSDLFNVSESTVRRDLFLFEKEGNCKRVHGGAVKSHSLRVLSDYGEMHISEKKNIFANEKDIVCKEAASLVADGDCVFIDGGTTTEKLIDYIIHKNVKIVTHSDLIIRRINNPTPEVIVIGGKYNAKYAMNTGPISYDTIRNFNFDIAFIGCTGLSLEEGIVYTAEMETRYIKDIAMKNARKSYLLIDSSKLKVKGFTKLTSINSFDGIICNFDEVDINTEIYSNWIWAK